MQSPPPSPAIASNRSLTIVTKLGQNPAPFAILKKSLPAEIAAFLQDKRWFGGKAFHLRSIKVEDVVPLAAGPHAFALFVFASVNFEDALSETYVIPLLAQNPSGEGHGTAPENSDDPDENAQLVFPLSDALKSDDVLRALYAAIHTQSVSSGTTGEIRGLQTKSFLFDLPLDSTDLAPKAIAGEQSNSSIIFGQKWILKVFRRIQDGENPELEVGRFLTERTTFRQIAPVGGWLEYRDSSGARKTLGVLQSFVSNEGDAWKYTLRALADFWRDAPKRFDQIAEAVAKHTQSNSSTTDEIPPIAAELYGDYLAASTLLGRRTAEMHQALASDPNDPAFAPEPFTADFRANLRETLVSNANATLDLLRAHLQEFAPGIRGRAHMVLDSRQKIVSIIRDTFNLPLTGLRIRIHGDYHLGQVLRAQNDFVIIDFEGEPGRPLADRVVKRSALQDVAGMLRSFHYAAYGPLLAPIGEAPQGDAMQLAVLARYWNRWVSRSFLRGYFHTAGNAAFLPKTEAERNALLQVSLLSKCLFELSYELNNRPDWLRVPLAGIIEYLENPGAIVG
jgi:maltose alpha-D-glucosyltransferase / alpha-amylase